MASLKASLLDEPEAPRAGGKLRSWGDDLGCPDALLATGTWALVVLAFSDHRYYLSIYIASALSIAGALQPAVGSAVEVAQSLKHFVTAGAVLPFARPNSFPNQANALFWSLNVAAALLALAGLIFGIGISLPSTSLAPKA